MNVQNYAIRLDIDTIVCANSIPKMLRLADELNCRFSFFVNVGKSISIPAAISRRLHSINKHRVMPSNKEAPKLSIKDKIGFMGILETILWNPELLPICKNALLIAKKYGHEVGLHGGLNHGIWQSFAANLSQDELANLLTPALTKYVDIFDSGFGFTSPGFTINPHCYDIFSQSGCTYVSDHVEPKGIIKKTTQGNLQDIPVTIAAPSNIDFLESYIASNTTTPLKTICANSIAHSQISVLYSHPCFAQYIGYKVFRGIFKEFNKMANNKLLIELV